MMRNRTDTDMKREIEQELLFDPKVNAAQVGVTVDGGAVSLFGSVGTFGEKWAAEDAAKRVGGVRTVAQSIAVKVPHNDKHGDSEIARAAQHALTCHVFIPQTITASVERGRVRLDGIAEWNYQREAAESSMRYIPGVTAVDNCVVMKPPQAPVEQVKDLVMAAIDRQINGGADSIRVEVSGGQVTLSGRVSSWVCIEDAVSAAWRAPGVTFVTDHMELHETKRA